MQAQDLKNVDKKQVERALEFYAQMLEKLQLEEYENDVEGEMAITPSEYEEMVRNLEDIEIDILKSIKVHGKSSSVLAAELSLSERR